MVRPDGVVKSIPAEDRAKFEALGYRPEENTERAQRGKEAQEKDYYSGFTQGAKAFAEGAFVGATGGLGRAVLDSPEAIAREKHQRLASTLGEAAGFIAPALISGGSSTLGKVLSVTPTGLVTRGAASAGRSIAGRGIAGGAVAAGIEGAAFGAGSDVGDAALTGDPLTVEGALAGAGLGIMFGAGAGLLGKAGTGIANRIKSVEDEVAESVLGSGRKLVGSDDAVRWRQVANDAPLPPTNTKPIADVNYQKLPNNPFQHYETASAVKEDLAKSFFPPEKIRAYHDGLEELQSKASQVMSQIDDQYRTAKAIYANAAKEMEFTTRLGNDVYERALADRALKSAAKSEMASVRANFRHLQSASKSGDVVKTQERLAKYRESVKNLAAKTGADVNFPDSVASLKARSEEAATVTAEIHKLIPEVAMDGHKTMGKMFDRDPQIFQTGWNEEAFARLDKVLKTTLPEAKVVRDQLAQMVEDLASGAGVSVKGGDPVTNLRAALKHARDSANAAGDIWMEGSKKYGRPTVPVSSESKGVVVRGQLDRFASKARARADELGTVTPEPSIPAAGTADSLTPPGARQKVKKGLGGRLQNIAVNTGITAAVNAALPGAGWAVKYGVRGALLAAKNGVKMQLHGVAKSLVLADKAIKPIAGKLHPLSQDIKGLLDTDGDLKDQFRRRSQELRELAAVANDRAFLAAQEMEAAGLGSEFSAGAHQVAVRAVQELVNKLPASPPGTTWGNDFLYESAPEQIEEFSQSYQAVFQPSDFLNLIGSAPEDIFPQAIETFQRVYPELYAEFRAAALQELVYQDMSEAETERLENLSRILNTPLAPTMAPEFIAEMVAMHKNANTPVQPPTPNGGNGGRPAGPAQSQEATKAQLQGLR